MPAFGTILPAERAAQRSGTRRRSRRAPHRRPDLEQWKPVADFKTHITTSTVLGVGYAAGAYQFFNVPAPTSVLAGVLCSVSGMLPDLDSDSGIPLRESLAFAAACVPMMLSSRIPTGWTNEMIVLAGAGLYILVRFGLGKLLMKYTVHRGMFHSIPAALIAGGVAFLLCATGDIYMRAFKAGGVLIGFFSHLILDEIWSIRFKGGIGLKSSSGTAMKLWGDSMWANLSCYVKLILVGIFVLNDPVWAGVSPEGKELNAVASTVVKKGEALQSVGATIVQKLETHLHLPSGSPTSTGVVAAAAGNGAITPQQQQSPSPSLLQQQQAYVAQQQAYAAQQAQAYAAQQQAAYQQQYQQWYQQQLYQQQLAQAQAAAYQAQYQQQYSQPVQGYAPHQYQQQYDPRVQPPQAQQQLPQYQMPPRADIPMTRRY